MTVFLVEDQEFNRCIIRERLTTNSGWTVAGEAGNAREAITWLDQFTADILLVDIGLPEPGDGFTVVAHARRVRPRMRLLVLTAHLNEYIVAHCEKYRVHGFLGKRTMSVGDLTPMLTSIGAGRTYFPKDYEGARDRWHADAHAIAKRLTPRENGVLHLIALGRSDHEIANELGISPATAATHKSAILQKLEQPNVAKLTVYAINHGYGLQSY